MPTVKTLFRILGLAILCVAIPACADKRISKSNFDKVNDKMTLKEVEALLGQGDKQSDGDGSNVGAQFGVAVGGGGGGSSTDDYVWESAGKKITITFTKGGKFVRKTSSGL